MESGGCEPVGGDDGGRAINLQFSPSAEVETADGRQ